jgi:hypothetical protein
MTKVCEKNQQVELSPFFIEHSKRENKRGRKHEQQISTNRKRGQSKLLQESKGNKRKTQQQMEVKGHCFRFVVIITTIPSIRRAWRVVNDGNWTQFIC